MILAFTATAFLSPSPFILQRFRSSNLRPHPHRPALARRVALRRLTYKQCRPVATASPDDPPPPPSDEESTIPSLSEQLAELEAGPKELRWSEIPFSSIREELDAIDEYETQENLSEKDPWPKFLRGAAYEFWGQPKLALAQYALTSPAAGLRQIPELWERRAYNAFKIGEVIASSAYFDISLLLHGEASGNELHFMHWFYDNFKDYVPKRNGPPAALQLAICKYCNGDLSRARDALVGQLTLDSPALEHAILWMFATSYRFSKNNVIPDSDYQLLRSALDSDHEWDSRLAKLITLFAAAAKKEEENQKQAELDLEKSIAKDGDTIDVATHLYLALYHEAFTRDLEKRNLELDLFNNIESSAQTNDTENFLFHAAKNRLTVPPTAKMTEIPESRT